MKTQTVKSCLWSDCGVISFRLCERNFRCKDCPIELALKSKVSGDEYHDNGHLTTLELTRTFLRNLFFSESCLYLKNHVVLRHIISNSYLAGLSDLMRLLFLNFNLSVLQSAGKLQTSPYFLLTSPEYRFRIPLPAHNILFTPEEDSAVENQWQLVAEVPELTHDLLLSKKEYLSQKMHIVGEFLNRLGAMAKETDANPMQPAFQYSYELMGSEDFIRTAAILGAEAV
ncbi:MAG: hypothetical protein HRU80_07070 [Ignavibacteriales bacterium]|nr:hypothetical protein [Ignavibacteriaceae bacterium]MCK6613496.1 hypothetical protein [Ignavibacteriaceae bacterium]QOJ28649.1 MAG: hypothetical protein HRU80_07070 [Ignavibacteriales bacterium]